MDDALHAAIAGHQRQRFRQQRPVVHAGGGIHQVNAGDVALAAPGRGEAAHAADVERLGADALLHQLADQQVEADAVAADDDEVGGFEPLPEQLDRHGAARIEDLGVLVDRDEAVGAAERR